MASKLEETELIEGLRRGREDAYRKLIDLYSDKLYRLALRILRQEEDAREILQEVFVKVLKKVGEFQGGSSLYTWLYRVTVNESLMRRREKAGHPKEESFEDLLPHYEFGYLIDDTRDWTQGADKRFECEEFHNLVRQLVDELPEELKTAYVLKDLEEISEDEVCGILDITKPTMKNRVHRARLILRKRIEKHYAP
ncbi:MAG TPA: sigma-70 family RNA polymerase sigma factor [bacterium]|nr:sigma-70 family RNA polymerase sigma factor [bacterium]